MHIDVAFTARSAVSDKVRGRSVVIIDILRASTTIAYALASGVASVHPVLAVEEARKLHQSWLGRRIDVVLAGERHALTPEGFDIGNSPTQVQDPKFRRKHLILTTSNGTRAALAADGADYCFTGCFANLAALCRTLTSIRNDVLLLCAGTDLGRSFCLEDGIAAGFIVRELQRLSRHQIDASDSALLTLEACKGTAVDDHAVYRLLRQTRHGRRLARLGLEGDLRCCSAVDAVNVVPVLSKGSFVPWQGIPNRHC